MSVRRLAASLVLDRLEPRTRGQVCAAGGLAALTLGRKLSGLGLLTKGVRDLEAAWRAEHPDFNGGWRERWRRAVADYEAQHQDPNNRRLHAIALPAIVVGGAGLLVWPSYSPPWFVSASTFTAGWALNGLGHAVFEGEVPGFAEDPVAVVAGPLRDLLRFGTI